MAIACLMPNLPSKTCKNCRLVAKGRIFLCGNCNDGQSGVLSSRRPTISKRALTSGRTNGLNDCFQPFLLKALGKVFQEARWHGRGCGRPSTLPPVQAVQKLQRPPLLRHCWLLTPHMHCQRWFSIIGGLLTPLLVYTIVPLRQALLNAGSSVSLTSIRRWGMRDVIKRFI